MNNFVIYNTLTLQQFGRPYKTLAAANKALSSAKNKSQHKVASELFFIDNIRNN